MSLKRLIQKILDTQDIVRELSAFGVVKVEADEEHEAHLIWLPGKLSQERIVHLNILLIAKLRKLPEFSMTAYFKRHYFNFFV